MRVCVRARACVRACVCVCVYLSMRVCVFLPLCELCIWVCMPVTARVCMSLCVYLCVRMYVSASISVCVFRCICVCVYVSASACVFDSLLLFALFLYSDSCTNGGRAGNSAWHLTTSKFQEDIFLLMPSKSYRSFESSLVIGCQELFLAFLNLYKSLM